MIKLYDFVTHWRHRGKQLRIIELNPIDKLTGKVREGYARAEVREGLGHPVTQVDLIENFTLLEKAN